MLKPERLQMFKELTEAHGAPGYEGDVRKIMRRHLAPYGSLESDNLGTLICLKEGTSPSPRVILSAHMDEVGLMVTQITKEGFLKFATLGGWWNHVLLAQRVIIKTAKGQVTGFIGSKPNHVISPEERKQVVEVKDMFIDVGAGSEEEVKNSLGIRPGDPIVPFSPFEVMHNGKTLIGKAWDNRIGCALLIETLRELQTTDHPNTLYGAATVQEEVGLRGAQTAAAAVNPDVAIVFDGCIANDFPGTGKDELPVRLGAGPNLILLDTSHIPNIKLRDLALETAAENQIPLNVCILMGGTDTGKIHMYGRGVPSIALGIPRRYTHSHSSIIHYDDYEQTLRLLVALIRKLDAPTVKSLVED